MSDPLQDQCWLVTGGSGQLGRAIQRNPPEGVRIWAPGRKDLDLTRLSNVDELLTRERITAIVNCGAYTAVDRAESEPELAHAVNAAAPARLAAAAQCSGIPIIHISTDYVFSGSRAGPWGEQDQTEPRSVYGRSKAAGEAAIRSSGAQHAIVRTAWLVSADGQNFIKTMLRLAQEADSLRVVADQIGTPTHAGDLAGAVSKVVATFATDRSRESGTWHCANAGETSWYGLAVHVFESAARFGLKVPATVHPISSVDYPTPAVRPLDSRLNTSAIARDFGVRLRPWQEAVVDIVEQLSRGRCLA